MTRDWKFYLIPLCIFGFFIRVLGNRFGLYHPDEHLIVNHALAFGTGDLNPHMFYFPHLFMYILFFVYGVFYGVGHLLNIFQKPDDFLNLYLTSPELFYVIGRSVSAFFGALTIWAVALLGKEYKSSRTALCAALLVAINFFHVRDSHFATMDIALTFFMTLSMVYLLRTYRLKSYRSFAMGVFLAGMASAVKYNAFILCVPIALSYAFSFFEADWKRGAFFACQRLFLFAFLAAAGLLASFFIFSPFVFLDYRAAYDFISRLYGINIGFGVVWTHHIKMLIFALDWPLFIVASVALAAKLFYFKKIDWIFFSLPIFYYLMISKAGQPFPRYILPIIPLAIVWSSAFLEDLEAWLIKSLGLKKPWMLVAVVVLALTLLPKTAHSGFLFLQKDTRSLAGDWIYQNVASGSAVAIDDPGQAPKLIATQAQIEEKVRGLNSEGELSLVKKQRLEKLLALKPYPSPSYNLYYLKTSPQKESIYSLLSPQIGYDKEVLRALKIRYLITNSFLVKRNPVFYDELKKYASLVAEFDPRKDSRLPMTSERWTYLAIDNSLWNYERPGPLISIYELDDL